MHILIIEDDAETARFLEKGLREAGHVVEQATNGRDGLYRAASSSFDALVVDRRLPEMDGLTLVSTLRATGIRTPVLFLTAVEGVDERVRGLRCGADDYLAKPFALAEVLARLEAITRRAHPPAADTMVRVADLVLDRLSHTVRRGGRPVDLQAQEFRVLEYLMSNAGTVVTRAMLLDRAWGYQFDPRTNVVDVHISRLRAKVDLPGMPALIHTVRGVGYTLRAPD
jgi:two-component system OmpR family response regulator